MSSTLSKKIIAKLKKNKVYIIATILFLALFIPLVMNPSITGYAAYQDMKDQGGNVQDYTKSMDKLLSTKENLETEITFCEDNTEELRLEINKKDKEVIKHLSEIDSLNEQIIKLNNDILELKTNYQTSINEMLQEYNEEKVKIRQENDNEIELIKEEKDKDIDDLNDEIKDLESQIQDLEDELDNEKDETNLVETRYNILAQNSANIICCIRRFDNANINYYEVVNNKIVCLETGTQEISCDI